MENLNKRLVDAKVVLVVGNGGIAMELVHSLISKRACQVWCECLVCTQFILPSHAQANTYLGAGKRYIVMLKV